MSLHIKGRRPTDKGKALKGVFGLKKKIFAIIMVFALIMTAFFLVNVNIVKYFVDDTQSMIDDTMNYYRFQNALSEEIKAFSRLEEDRTRGNMEDYQAACQKTQEYLQELPFDYEEIGEDRYAVTWNIRNSYPEYQKQRDMVVYMSSSDSQYIQELYRTYRMQEYLESYASRLMDEGLTQVNTYYEEESPGIQRMPYMLLLLSVLVFALLLIMAHIMTRGMVATILKLSEASEKIENNDFSFPDIKKSANDEMGQLVQAFNKMKRATGDYLAAMEKNRLMEKQLLQKELEQSQLEQRFSLAQLQLLRSQLNPHFLFNTLHMIACMAKLEEAPVTEQMMGSMSNLLRYSLRTTEPFAPLNQELKVVEDYMYIQKMRFGSRIRYYIDCQPGIDQEEIPVFLFQPLVENAVIHGIAEKEGGGAIYIRIRKKEEGLWISVADTGLGMSEEKLAEIREAFDKRGSGLGIGLGNIYKRISMFYQNGTVTINSREGCGTVVQMTFADRK